MKKFILALTALLTVTVSASAMSYEQARQQALFLTDKMAYELNLTDDQYEAAYEINLDYLMSISDYSDLYGAYWQQRNIDLSYILLDWQYRAYINATYFYRPLYWSGGYWHFGIYARYPHRDYFFFGRPDFYGVYRGSHSWSVNGGRSWYNGRRFGPRPGYEGIGMRDGFNRGDYGRGSNRVFGNGIDRSNGSGRNSFGSQSYPRQNRGSFGNGVPSTRNNSTFGNGSFGNRQSSTRSTVTRPETSGSGYSHFGSRSNGSLSNGYVSPPNNTFSPSRSTSPRSSSEYSFGSTSRSTGTFGSGSRSNSGSYSPSTRSNSGSFETSPHSGSRSFGSGSRSMGGSFDGGMSSSGSFSPSTRSNTSSFGGGARSNSGSFGSGSRSMGGSSFGGRGGSTGPSQNSGGAHFGSRR